MALPYPMPWTVRGGEQTAGVPRTELGASGFVHLRRGAWAAPGVDVRHPDVRIAGVVATMPPDAVLGGWSAARLHEWAACDDGLDVFDGGLSWEDLRGPGPSLPDVARVVLCVPRDSRLALRSDVRVFRTPVGADQRLVVGGVPVTTGDRTAFDLARRLPLHQAVVGLDRLLHLGVATREGVVSVMSSSRRWRGIAAARRSLRLADEGSESPQESLLRLAWIAAGFPVPRANRVVRDLDGRFVARVDLVDGDAGVVGEYDGAVHADAARRSDDARRQEGLDSLGLVVVRATAVDLLPGGVAAWQRRLRGGYQRAGRRPAAARRWTIADV